MPYLNVQSLPSSTNCEVKKKYLMHFIGSGGQVCSLNSSLHNIIKKQNF